MKQNRKFQETKSIDKKDFRLASSLIIFLLVSTAIYLWALGGSHPPESPPIGGAFTLRASDGRIVKTDDFRGHPLLIYFGYTACRDVCPLTLDAVRNALAILGRRGGSIQPLFITIDPLNDTPTTLQKYLRQFSPRLLGLTGTKSQIDAVEKKFGIDTEFHKTNSINSIDHTSVLYFLNARGAYVGAIPADANGNIIAQSLARYLDGRS